MQEPKGLPWLPGDREAQSGGGPGRAETAGNAACTATHSVGSCSLGGATRAARGPVVNGWNPSGFPGSRDIKGTRVEEKKGWFVSVRYRLRRPRAFSEDLTESGDQDT